MTVSTESQVHFDPYDAALIADPYPMFARLRDEAPPYYNANYDFYAVSSFSDVNRCLVDHVTFSSMIRGFCAQLPPTMPVPGVEAVVDISNAVLFLTPDESRYITGDSLPVDAGALLK